MNNKGQTLVIFVFLLPVILALVAYLTDSSLMMYEDNKLDRLNEIVIDYSIENKDTINSEKIRTLLLKNDRDLTIEEIILTDHQVSIKMSKEIPSLFGKVLGINKYTVKSSLEKTI